MKKLVLFSFFIALTCNFLFAQKLKRVNNNGFDPDYTTLSAAVAAASNGDTIYVEGSAVEYEGCIITKQLTVIGPGYFLGENPKTQAVGLPAEFKSAITFASGSAGSTIMGCYIPSHNLVINTNNISVIRNNIYSITTESTISNINILQNFIHIISVTNSPTINITNSVISNNYFGHSISIGNSSGGLIITNNICTYWLSSYGSTIQNNIITQSSYDIYENSGNSISYNLLAISGTNANNNQYGVTMTTVFVDFNGNQGYSSDGRWELAVGSPAIGAGSGGVDCGIFGGLSPYVLSGIPNLPHIYEADIPAAVSSGTTLGISIKVKSGD
jgi:hypothetical protein